MSVDPPVNVLQRNADAPSIELASDGCGWHQFETECSVLRG